MKTLAFTLFALFAGGTLALADEVRDFVAKLPAEIEDIRIVGSWEADESTEDTEAAAQKTDAESDEARDAEKPAPGGVYRLIHIRRNGTGAPQRLFLQWLPEAENGILKAPKDMIEVAEFTELTSDVIDISVQSDPEGLVVFIETLDPKTNIDETYELFVESPESYQFGPTTN